jgi:hypothetical protein
VVGSTPVELVKAAEPAAPPGSSLGPKPCSGPLPRVEVLPQLLDLSQLRLARLLVPLQPQQAVGLVLLLLNGDSTPSWQRGGRIGGRTLGLAHSALQTVRVRRPITSGRGRGVGAQHARRARGG